MTNVGLLLVFILLSHCSLYESQDRTQFEEDYSAGQIKLKNTEGSALTCWEQSSNDLLAAQLTETYQVEVTPTTDQNVEVCIYEKKSL